MKTKLVLSIFILLNTFSFLNAQQLPELRIVVEQFFEQYHTSGDVGFERRPDGYYVGFQNVGQPISDQEKFYDEESKQYLPLNNFHTYYKDTIFYSETNWQLTSPKPSPRVQAKNYLQKLNQYDLDAFNRQPYYGYKGWYLDVITFFEQEDHLDDDALNALARAYFQAGANLLTRHSNYNIDERTFDLPHGQNALSENQLSDYLYYHDKCIATYEQLVNSNPDYITPVGTVKTKHANEIVDGFITLLYYQNEESAREQLRPNIYDDYLLMYARNILRSCPKDAILYTYGDSDTYPLYYVQAIEGFRTDVIIANLSLLTLPRYRYMLLNGPLGAKKLSTGLPDFYYKDEFILWRTPDFDNTDVLKLSEIYSLLPQKSLYHGEESPLFLNPAGGGFLIDVPEGHSFLNDQNIGTLHWSLPKTKHFMFPDDIFQIDMLQANQWSRPLCFSLTNSYLSLKSWKHHLALEGLVYRVYPDSLDETNIYSLDAGTVNIDFNLEFWENEMVYDTTTLIRELDKLPFYQISILSSYKFALSLYQANEREKATTFIENLMLRFPNKVKPWGYSWMILMNLLEKHGETDKAIHIATTIVSNYEDELFDKKDSYYYSNIKQLKTFAASQGLTELAIRCEKLY